ncbi:MAG TPA: ABC transporter substrate-binding protein [Stellaceae bacterium]|nr:ABC transporter substrate-binding protein [Stellaceae bacterium]
MCSRVWTALVTVALGVAGVAGAAEPVKIRTSWLVVPASIAPFLKDTPDVATHFGVSYTLETIHFTGTAPMITGLAADEIDIAPLSFSAFSLAVTNGGLSDLRIVADQAQDGVHGYHTNEYYVLKDGPIRTIEDLKGKILATNAIGGAVDMALRAMLRKHGIEDKRDTTIIEVELPQQRAMLEAHKVDLVSMLPPFSFDPAYGRIARILFTQFDAMGPAQTIVWTARKAWLERNRAAVVDYMEDTLRLLRWMSAPDNHDAAVKLVADFTKLPPERLDWIFTQRDAYRDPNGLPDLNALQANIDLQTDLGFLRTKVVLRDYADLSYINEAAARLK